MSLEPLGHFFFFLSLGLNIFNVKKDQGVEKGGG